ncbi:XapX domain-containing protein [Duganella hordei]|uniref:XapX domain-containing protein n=1 Tax=Duganella hordei TaxID=2865934 RepID=UPI00333E30C9
MKNYAISLLTGILVGLIYAVFRIPSALPPAVVFIGFLGMFLGEKFAETILRRHAAVPEIQAAAATAVADAAPVPPQH